MTNYERLKDDIIYTVATHDPEIITDPIFNSILNDLVDHIRTSREEYLRSLDSESHKFETVDMIIKRLKQQLDIINF